MSQPRKTASKLACRLIVRVNDEDRARIRACAQSAGLTVSEYVRRMAVNGQVVVRRDSAYGMSLAFQLRKVGINLNQLTRVANTSGELPEGLAGVCQQVETILDRITKIG